MIELKRNFPWITKKVVTDSPKTRKGPEDLREFVYLDEVSLASLLASQKGEITDAVTEQTGENSSSEVSGKLAGSIPLTYSAEVSSKFQSATNASLQIVRKASAQSLFRELHSLKDLRKISPIEPGTSSPSLAELFDEAGHFGVYKATALKRGELLEFKVKLSASWIYKISILISEFADMFEESPALFIDNVRFTDVYNATNVNKVIGRLLAGLIPVDGLVTDYSIVKYQNDEYIVEDNLIVELDIERVKLQLVGVTEHVSYWKDIRRVLFSDSEFTVLCRLSKSGLQSNWNPIKTADIFKEFAPDLAREIEASSKLAMAHSHSERQSTNEDGLSNRFVIALIRYKDLVLAVLKKTNAKRQSREIDRQIAQLNMGVDTATAQRAAFAQVSRIIAEVTGATIDADTDLKLREAVRASLGLSVFPQEDPAGPTQEVALVPTSQVDTRLLDVEVVAIYW